MSTTIYQVDAFTDTPFAGNPAAVCLLDEPRDDEWMQAVAAEMNLSETAFLLPADDGWSLQWFTPSVEVDLCGHATLASAHALWEAGRLPPREQARFHTRSGLLTAVRKEGWIEMDFPAQPVEGRLDPPPELAGALGAEPVGLHAAGWTHLAEMADELAVRSLSPDFAALKAGLCGSVIVTAASGSPGIDFVSRFFAPVIGIDEDPVTGAAHCVLGPFWGQRLGEEQMVGRQVSARGGTVKVALAGERVKLSGQAVTVLTGELV